MKSEKNRIMKNEAGSILVIALVILVLLTVAGISASRTSSVDLQIAANDIVYNQNFFTAEAAAMQAMQAMEDMDLKIPRTWIGYEQGSTEQETIQYPAHIRDETNWTNGFPGGASAEISSVDTNVRYFALSKGIDVGGSLDMAKSRVYSYRILGRSNRSNGLIIVELGYKKAFN